MKKYLIKISLFLLFLCSCFQFASADDNLLKEITANRMKVPKIGDICPLNNGKSYAVISNDKKSIVVTDFEKGTVTDTLFTVNKIENCPL